MISNTLIVVVCLSKYVIIDWHVFVLECSSSCAQHDKEMTLVTVLLSERILPDLEYLIVLASPPQSPILEWVLSNIVKPGPNCGAMQLSSVV